jgi:hypothetical protein
MSIAHHVEAYQYFLCKALVTELSLSDSGNQMTFIPFMPLMRLWRTSSFSSRLKQLKFSSPLLVTVCLNKT